MTPAPSLSDKFRHPTGLHQTIDFFGCDLRQTELPVFWSKLLGEALAATQLTVLHERLHAFTPQGLTGVYLLSTSHLSFHTWPEHGYVACDLFSCGDEAEARGVIDCLRNRVQHERCVVNSIHRGYRFEDTQAR